MNRLDGTLELTGPGQAAADRVFEARRQGLATMLAGWSPEQHTDLSHLLDRLSRELLGQDADRHLLASGPSGPAGWRLAGAGPRSASAGWPGAG